MQFVLTYLHFCFSYSEYGLKKRHHTRSILTKTAQKMRYVDSSCRQADLVLIHIRYPHTYT
jgi:hypothetical protein